MSKSSFGRSLYYATDKNISDALNEHKVDAATLATLFHARNTLVSNRSPRKWLADYFSTLSHDYYDHKSIATKLGIASRRERVTSVQVTGVQGSDQIMAAISKVKSELEEHGDVVTIKKKNDRIVLRVEYSIVDYRRSEFNQVQEKDGEIEFQKEGDSFVVRNTHNNYVDDVRDLVLSSIETTSSDEIMKHSISLEGFPDPKTRSEFFYNLMNGLSGYINRDVTDVYVFKAGADDHELEAEPHIERVALKGTGVTQTEHLARLAADGYYIVKVGWRFAEEFGKGAHYAAEALFTSPADCTGFSYILLGVHDADAGLVSSRRRGPNRIEIDFISRAIEARARFLLEELKQASQPENADAD